MSELGYDVDASEFNDFRREDLGQNSYDACLRTIDSADYLVLLIGARAGAWYDEATKTTITMMEYRHAYERVKRGELKLIIFVRREIWNLREDRAALGRLLGSDADAIFEFIHEVGRIEEVNAAMAGEGSLPQANWVHPFDTFRDVVDALRPHLGGALGLRRVALTGNLQQELIGNLRQLLERGRESGKPSPRFRLATAARAQFSGGPFDTSGITARGLMLLSAFAISETYAGERLSTQFLDEALVSGEFLDFDPQKDRYVVGLLQSAMNSLKREILALRQQEAAISNLERQALVERYRHLEGDNLIEVENPAIYKVVVVHDRQRNVVALLAAILRALGGDGTLLKTLDLLPLSPFPDAAAGIEKATPSAEEVEEWARSVVSTEPPFS